MFALKFLGVPPCPFGVCASKPWSICSNMPVMHFFLRANVWRSIAKLSQQLTAANNVGALMSCASVLRSSVGSPVGCTGVRNELFDDIVLRLALICLLLALTAWRKLLSRSPTSGPGRRMSCFFSSPLMRSSSRSSTSLRMSASVFLMRRRCTPFILTVISYKLGSRPCDFDCDD